MLRLARAAVVTFLVVVVVVGTPWVAWADPDFFSGNAECNASGCAATAESGEDTPGAPGAGPSSGSGSGEEGGATAAQAEPSECDLDPACDTLATTGDEGEGGAAAVDPVEVANAARDSLTLPEPEIVTSPGAETPVLVQVPVWLWLEDGLWETQTAEAEVPGGTVSVTAEPSRVRWSMGDGATVTCDGPGVAYDPAEHDPASSSPECGHTYTRASTNEPNEAYELRVDMLWNVTWESSDGEGGELDALVTSTASERRVIESHGLVTSVD